MLGTDRHATQTEQPSAPVIGQLDRLVEGSQNYTGHVQADMLRLNVAVPPTAHRKENPIGLVAGDPAGFPNGRRPIDDVTAIELKAVAGATIPLVDQSYTPDGHHHGHDPARPHVAVLARPTPHGAQCAAVYPGLRAGCYDLWLRPDAPTALTVTVTVTVTVTGGQVVDTACPAAEAS